MTQKFSFTKYEQELRSDLRQKVGSAESTEDVKKFFVYIIRDLLNRVFEGRIPFEYEDIRLSMNLEDGFTINRRLWDNEEFSDTWENSDLSHIIRRMAESAVKRHRHLEKHPEKTEAKIFATP